MVGGDPWFWGGTFEIIGWVLAGLLAILVLVFTIIIVTGKKVTILGAHRAAILNEQHDEHHTIEGSLDRENTEERRKE